MTTPNPVEDLLARLAEQFGHPLNQSVETVVRRVLEPFQLVPKAEFEAHSKALAEAEQALATLVERVATLEAKAAKKKKKSAASAKSKPKPAKKIAND